MRRKVLVTGASGFLGTRVVTSLVQEDSVEVYAGFNTSPLNDEIPKFCHVCCNNLSKPEEIKKTLKGLQPDVVIHLGAISSPGRCEADPGLAFATNDAGALVDSILEVAPDTVVVFASSDLVYDGGTSSEGGRAYHPANDESLVQPLNIYAKTKAAGEENIKRLKNGVILRLSNMIGRGSGKFFDFLLLALQEKKHIGLRHDEYRSFIAVDDVVRLIANIVKRTPMGGIYNVGGPAGLSRLELAHTLAKVMGVEIIVASDSGGKSKDPQEEDQWCVYKQSNAEAIKGTGIYNPADVTMESSATETEFGVTFRSMEETFRDIVTRKM